MLEGLLKDDNVSNPVRISREMLEFLKTDLRNGGQQANTRFFNLVVPLCDKILGKIGGKDESYRQLYGGWMEEQEPWIRKQPQSIPTPTPGGPIGHLQELGSDVDPNPVVELLATAGPDNSRYDLVALTLVEALSLHAESHNEVYLEFPFLALPKSMQDAWLEIVEQSSPGSHSSIESICSENDMKLLSNRLRKKPFEQQAILQFYRKKKNRVLTPNQQYQYSNNPGLFHTPPQSPTFMTAKEDTSEDPVVFVTGLEYFLLRFLRYPLFLPNAQTAKSTSSSTIPGATVHHIPGQRGNTHLRSGKIKYGHNVYLIIFQKHLEYFLPSNNRNDCFALQDEANLFLELIIALWFESCVRLSPEAKAQADWKETRARAKLANHVETNLNASHDLTQEHRYPYVASSKLMRAGIRHVAIHLIKIVPSVENNSPQAWNIEPFMAKLQQPFYNFIRGSLRFAGASSDEFFEALSIWLIWLEPWNRRPQRTRIQESGYGSHHYSSSTGPKTATKNIISSIAGKKGMKSTITVDTPRHDQNSKYDPSWEPYVAANLYMYLVPLAIFVRRARELDFSVTRSFETVSKVFRVFTPELVNVLSRHLDSIQDSRLVEQHKNLLGVFCPYGRLQLSSLERDLRQLFEDVDSRRVKSTHQAPMIQTWFESGTNVFLSTDQKVVKLKERAIVIAQLPVGTNFRSTRAPNATSKGSLSPLRPDRLPNGELSVIGREQIWKGIASCSPDEISYVGDYMRRMPNSHEPEILVLFLLLVSDFLNDCFGLNKETPGRRVNLRWFADYRHLLFACTILFAATMVLLP